MKKTIAKTAALIMAAMLAGNGAVSCLPMNVSAAEKAAAADTEKEDAAMKAALTVVKKRITVPDELTEFKYYKTNGYGKTIYKFTWYTPEDAEVYKSLEAAIMGDIVIYYSLNDGSSNWSGEPKLAKLTEAQLVEKAKGYAKQLNPVEYGKMKFELARLELSSRLARVEFDRYESGVKVPENNGRISLDKDTGELVQFEATWWDNVDFADPSSAKSQEEIQSIFKKMCKLTPVYKISWEQDEKTQKSVKKVNLVYEPDMTREIDAFTGKPSTIWDDMEKAEGTNYFGIDDLLYEEGAVSEDAEAATAAGADAGGVNFTKAELEKIEQSGKLLTQAQLFEMLKKDKVVALDDNYKTDDYNISSYKDDNGKEVFEIYLDYKLDKQADNHYKNVSVRVNGETGEILMLNKYNLQSSDGLPKLDVAKVNAVADVAVKSVSKKIASQYKADKENTETVRSWQRKVNGKSVTEYETERDCRYSRYVNGIRVEDEYIRVTVDSLGNVTHYYANHTDGLTFPSADRLTADEAFEKLFKQKKFDYYYDGWIGKDGVTHTYLLYSIGSFYLNAKTGALCEWDGSKISKYTNPREVKYSDIKGIPQEQAILALQKYGVVVTKENKFNPATVITEEEFAALLSSALSYDVPVFAEEAETENMTAEEKAALEAEKKDKAETTREEAAVMFTQMYDSNGIAKLKGIFRTPFSDVKSTDENVGYIAIAYAKGFMPKTADGKLNGGHKITRAEAAQMLYDYLKLLSE